MAGAVASMPGEEAAFCVADIEGADFIALQLDTSEVAKHDQELADLESFFQMSVQQLHLKRLPLRLGVCCARWQEKEGLWDLRSHEIGLWPGSCLEISAELALSRRKHAEASGAQLCSGKSRWAAQLSSPARWVLNTVQQAKVPLILHDGLFDLLQLHDKFIGDVSPAHMLFGGSWIKQFPAVFDTRLLALEALTTSRDGLSSPPVPIPGTGGPAASSPGELLEKMIRQLQEGKKERPALLGSFRELGSFRHRASCARSGLVTAPGGGSCARRAMEVAELFVLQVGIHLGCAEPPEPESKRRRVDSARECSDTDLASSTNLPLSHACLDELSPVSPQCEDTLRSEVATALTPSSHIHAASVPAAQESELFVEPGTPEKVLKRIPSSPSNNTIDSSTRAKRTPATVKAQPAWYTCATPEQNPPGASLQKRARSVLEEAAAGSRTMTALASTLARLVKCPSSMKSSTGCQEAGAESACAITSSLELCRRFQNRVAAVGTLQGYLRLDTLLHVRLVKQMRKTKGQKCSPAVVDTERFAAKLDNSWRAPCGYDVTSTLRNSLPPSIAITSGAVAPCA